MKQESGKNSFVLFVGDAIQCYRCVWLQHIAQSLASKCIPLLPYLDSTLRCIVMGKSPSPERASFFQQKVSAALVEGHLESYPTKPHDKKETVERITKKMKRNQLNIAAMFETFRKRPWFFRLNNTSTRAHGPLSGLHDLNDIGVETSKRATIVLRRSSQDLLLSLFYTVLKRKTSFAFKKLWTSACLLVYASTYSPHIVACSCNSKRYSYSSL